MLAQAKYIILDMDGTVYLDGQALPGAVEFLQRAQQTGRQVLFFTNNSSNDVTVCQNKLHSMGIAAEPGQIILSTQVAVDYLQREHPGKRVYLLGNERMQAIVQAAGIPLVQDNADLVLLGFDTTLTYDKIYRAARYIANGAVYIATHPDVNCPASDGFMPDTGAMIALFAASTGKTPLVLGKPTTHTVEYITRYLGCTRGQLAFVGDRLETDIAIGANHNIPSALVFTGATTRELYAASPIRADIAVDSLAQLLPYLGELA